MTLTYPEIGLRLAAALVVGAIVGLERERKRRPAGLRTMILISLGSAAFMLAGMKALEAFPQTGQAEVTRLLQGLMSGIGFLGAGAVIQNKRAVRGLTTAAAVWVTAAGGAMCGLGQYAMVAMLAALALFTLVVLERVEDRFFPEPLDDERRRDTDQSPAAGRLQGEDTV
jgi:putative Mg2+ transporter-C (MgtC) family protein